jgi:hypothetical protein
MGAKVTYTRRDNSALPDYDYLQSFLSVNAAEVQGIIRWKVSLEDWRERLHESKRHPTARQHSRCRSL